jgi:hypothetical protein
MNPTSREIKRAKADLEALTPEEWQPCDGDEAEIHIEGQNIEPGSVFAIGRSGLVFVQSPGGRLSVITGGIESMPKAVSGSPDSIEMKQEGEQLFLYVDGRKIAKRGHPGGRFAGKSLTTEDMETAKARS